MKQTISLYDFRQAFSDMARSNNFSYGGLTALYDYINEIENSCGTEIELDVIAICVEYTEYENLKELQDNYNNIESFEDLEDYTQVIRIYDYNNNLLENFIILDF